MGCYPTIKKTIDIRINTRFAGENIFLVQRKNFVLKRCTRAVMFGIMGRPKKPDNEKVRKPGVSLDQECRLILSKIIKFEASIRNDLAQSQAIRKCIKLAWDLHFRVLFEKYEANLELKNINLLDDDDPKGKAKRARSRVLDPEENSGGGSSTATTKPYRRNG